MYPPVTRYCYIYCIT